MGNDYFCEFGLHETWTGQSNFYPNDILWDGEDCLPSSTCCSQHNLPYFVKQLPTSTTDDILWDGEDCLPSSTCCSQHDLPYFVKQLSTSTTDDIEARICLDQGLFDENIAVELVELYV